MNLPSFKTIRRSIIGAGLISTGLVVSHFVIKLQANEFQSSLEAEVELKREAVAQRPYLERLEEIAERDREVLAETKRWSSLIEETTRKMFASDTFSVSTPSFHAEIPERFEGHWASQSLQRTMTQNQNNGEIRNCIDNNEKPRPACLPTETTTQVRSRHYGMNACRASRYSSCEDRVHQVSGLQENTRQH